MRKIIALLVAVLVLCSGQVFADTFRCPNGNLVSTGDSVSVVSVKCDQPTNKTRRSEAEDNSSGRVRYVEVEEWTYNQGADRLIHFLVFRNGYLVQVNSGSFGQ